MKKRAFLKRSLLGTAFLSIPALSIGAEKVSGRFVHTVLFWLKPETDVDDFIGGTENFLKKIEVIQRYHIGKPAGTPREVVDNSYSVCLVVTFNSKEDQDIYQDHSAHISYVEARKHQWNKVVVYDSWGI